MLMTPDQPPARLHFGPNGFRILRTGAYVPCAVTGQPIALDELRYWSVERQEPYASAEIATRRQVGAA